MGISTIDRRGRLHVLKRCDAGTGWRGCYSLQSVDWAPDGRRLAFSVTTIAAISTYNGLHVLNIRTGRDRHLPRDGFDIDWSPDGSRFAYVEFARFANDWVDLHGARRRVRAHACANRERGSGRVAFLVSRRQEIGVRDERRLGVFVPAARPLRVGGRCGRQRSASGRKKRSRSCLVAQRPHDRLPRLLRIKLVTPTGRDVTPRTGARCRRAIGVAGQPVWSPDGRKIAVGNRRGVYVMNADGSNLSKLTSVDPTGIFGFSRPTWQPLPH